MPVLYVVATPIGNLEDISLRALRILHSVKLIAAEDTRKTKRLLNTYDIKTPLTSYHEHNKWSKLEYLLPFLSGTGDVALVSEAGTPGISDPGHELIVAAAQQGIPIVAVPGPSVVITALTVSALPTDRFTFFGFLPRTPGDRRRTLKSISDVNGTIVILEAPHRLRDLLQDMLTTLGNRQLVICRELTKIHEEVFRGSISDALERFTEPRGEFTIIVEGLQSTPVPSVPSENVEQRLRAMRQAGLTAKEAIPRLSKETGLARRDLYRSWLKLES